MPLVPTALLSKFYVKGSLTNTSEGFEFRLKNTIAPSTIINCGKVEVDGQPYPVEKVFIVKKVSERPATSVTSKNPLPLDVNEEIRIILKGLSLPPGFHRISVSLKTKEVGEVEIPVEDTL